MKTKQSVLAATGRPLIVEDTTKSAAQILSESKLLEQLKHLRNRNAIL